MADWIISEPLFEADQICPMYMVWPWNGHRRFAYDLVRFLKPRRIVELGTYWGTSFFSFCQGAKDHSLDTECIAVDTWVGDEHSGTYQEDVYKTVNKVKNTYYKNVNTRLLKMFFSEALELIKNRSIDILHIDGLHTYEAVRDDYQTWHKKLAADGIVLFHDMADSVKYGSVRFWKEISEEYPHFTFQHSWGLGVLFPKGNRHYQQMLENNFDEKMKIYEYRSEMELARAQVDDLKKFTDAQNEELERRERLIKEQSEQALKHMKDIQRLERALGDATRQIEEMAIPLHQKIAKIIGLKRKSHGSPD